MNLTIRKIVKAGLPKFLSKKIVSLGESYKRTKREKRRFAYGGGNPFVKDISVEGVSFKIILDPVKNSGVDEDITKNGFWEKELSVQFKKYINDDSIFLDIGANIGYHSLFVAAIIKGPGKVYSFEPLPHLCKQLQDSVRLNGFSNIEICNFGLAEKEGEHTINIRDENTGGSSLLDLHNLEKFKVKDTEKITLKRLDSFLRSDTKVDVVKIDVEGYEFEVLKGGINVLTKDHPVIFMEFSPVFYVQDYVQKPQDLVSFLKNLSYSFFCLDGQSLNLDIWLKEEENLNSQIDIICKVV